MPDTQLLIDGVPSVVTVRTGVEHQALGDFARSFDDVMRSSISEALGHASVWRVTTKLLSMTEVQILERRLLRPGPRLIQGAIVAPDPIEAHVMNVRREYADSGLWLRLSFELHETTPADTLPFVLLDYRPGDEDVTFDRDLAAFQRSAVDGAGDLLVSVAADGIRDAHWVLANDGQWHRTTLTERSATNLVLQSQTLGTTWTPIRATISANADVAPDGTTTADRLVEDATAASTHSINQGSLTITADGTVTGSIYLKAGTRTWARIRVHDGTATHQFGTYVNLATGVIGSTVIAGTGALATKRITALTNGWHRVAITGTVGSGGTSAAMEVFIAEADNDVTFDGDGASYISVWGAQLEDVAAVETSYIPTTTVSVARERDELSLAVDDTIRTISGMIEFVELGTSLSSVGAARGLFNFGTTSGAKFWIRQNNADGDYIIQLWNSADPLVQTTLNMNVVMFDHVRIWWQVTVNQSANTMTMSARFSVNGAAWSSTSTTSATTKDTTVWSQGRYYIGSRGGTDSVGVTGHIRHLVVQGDVDAETLAAA